MKKNKPMALAAALALAALVGSSPALADSATATGEVKKVDAGASKVTIKHGPIKAFDMPDEMTMVYRVKEPAMLNQLKVGDKVKFEAEKADGGIMVTKIQKSK